MKTGLLDHKTANKTGPVQDALIGQASQIDQITQQSKLKQPPTPQLNRLQQLITRSHRMAPEINTASKIIMIQLKKPLA